MVGEGDRALLEAVREKPDLTLPELAEEVALRTGISVSQTTIHRRLTVHGITRKKNGRRG